MNITTTFQSNSQETQLLASASVRYAEGRLAPLTVEDIERIVADQCPPNRTETRRLRSRALSRVGLLIRHKIVKRIDRDMIQLWRPTVQT